MAGVQLETVYCPQSFDDNVEITEINWELSLCENNDFKLSPIKVAAIDLELQNKLWLKSKSCVMSYKLTDISQSLIASVVLLLVRKKTKFRFKKIARDEDLLLKECELFLAANNLSYNSTFEEIQNVVEYFLIVVNYCVSEMYSYRGLSGSPYSEQNIIIVKGINNRFYPVGNYGVKGLQ